MQHLSAVPTPCHTGHNHAPVCGAVGRTGKEGSEESKQLLLGGAAIALKGSSGRPYKAESYGVRDLSCLVPAEVGSNCRSNLIYSGPSLRRIVGHLMDKMTIWQRALCLWEESRQRVTFISHPPRIKLLAVRSIRRWLSRPARVRNHSKKRVMKSVQASFCPVLVQYMQCIPTKARLPFVVCQSSLKCDSGVMDNCTAIYCTVSSIL